MGLLHQALLHLALQLTTNVITTTDFVQRQSTLKKKKICLWREWVGEGEGAGWWEGGGGGIAICEKDTKATKIVNIMLFKTNKKLVYYIRRCYIWHYNQCLMK